MTECTFCSIVRERSALLVHETAQTLSFLDHRPLFPGHVLVVPKTHIETVEDLPSDEIAPFFAVVQHMSRAVRSAVDAPGSFIATNTHVSQSVPHLHVHVVPRRPKDGLRGFFWPRLSYDDADHAETVRAAIAAAMDR